MGENEDSTTVYVVGPYAFQNSLMRRQIQNENVFCRTYSHLNELSSDERRVNTKRPLIFYDCQDMDGPELFSTIDSYLSAYLESSHLIVFNVKKAFDIEKYAMQKGIKGFLYEHDDSDLLSQVVKTVADGGLWVARKKMEECISSFPAAKNQSAISALTNREKEILRMVAQGESNEQIAEQLCLSKHTVKTHLNNIYKKNRRSQQSLGGPLEPAVSVTPR